MNGCEIAKYRKEGHAGWWLTDFTMAQVEGRLAALQKRVEDLEARLERQKPYLRHKEECGYYKWRWVPTGATGEVGKFKQATGPCDCGFEEATK